MPIIEIERDSKSKKHQLTYCCPAKQYFNNNTDNLVKTLKIVPRVIIYKKSLKVNNSYESIINITNKGLYKRRLIYSTDSSDTTVRVYPTELTDNFLQPDQALQITVRIEPIAKSNINRRRHVFLSSQHPNMIFSIPIIILTKDDNRISLPSSLKFAPTTAENFTYYEMILYNKSAKKLQFNIKCSNLNLTVQAKSFNILKKDYSKILLKLYCKDCAVVDDCLKLKFNMGDNFDIPFRHEPLQWSLFIDTININFGSLRFKREESTEFSICNESLNDIVFYVDFNSMEADAQKATKPTIQKSNNSQIEFNDMKISDKGEILNQPIDKFPFRHFEFKPNCSTIPANSSYSVQITFRPVMHKDFLPTDDDIPPFSIVSGLTISWKAEQRNICLRGQIMGPEIEILPAVLDLRQVYFGEEHCAQIKAVNCDDMCDAHVNLYDVINRDTAHIFATPNEGLTLKPHQSGIFQIQFYCTVIGKFMVKMEFKVKNGGIYSMIIKGYSKHVRVKCFPDIIDLGVTPIAMPQKRLVLLMNPLTVPLTVQCTVKDDGNEIPLVLNTRNVEEHLPITVNDPFHYLQQCTKADSDPENTLSGIEELKFQFGFDEPQISLMSVRSQMEDNSSCSSEFEKLALDLIPDMAHNFVSYLKTIKIFDKPELEKQIVEEALNVLLKTPYFYDMDKYKNYTQMDWNSLPTDPKEIYCNTEIIRLKPNTGKVISIVVIPNAIGYHHKYVELRVCPLMPATSGNRNTNSVKIVETDHMISKLWIEYNCAIPEIIWDNVVIMQDKLYAGEFYDFQMSFENNSCIGGFFYYDVIPHSNLGIMKFPNNKWKYFIEPGAKIYVPCQVKFNKLGFITLAGLIKFVGVNACYPFHIKSEVLPPKVNFLPRSIVKTVDVLVFSKLYIFIENATPTTTWFNLKLKDDTDISIEPCGGQLAPTGQAMYITLNLLYKDPGTYKNVLYITMEFATIEKIPITINVKGIPIFFEPEIRANVLNIGSILCNTEEDYYADKPNYIKVIKVVNKGLRHYRLSITRTKCSAKPTCSINSSKVKLTIKPNNLIVPPLMENSFNILINCCESTTIFSEFRIQLTDQNDVKHMETSSFIMTATFILPQLSWNRREITMNYYRTHKYKEHEQFETVKLRNITENSVDHVNIKLTGPFKIKELFEHNYVNELYFSMGGLETKEFFIMLNKDLIRNRLNTYYEGCITCYANSRVQKSVRLKLMVFVPKIYLKQNQVTLFTKNTEGGTYIELVNTGEIPAIYKWKKLKEECHYIRQEDDAQQVASMILSDLIHMLDLENINIEADSELNMTHRYQKFKCILKDLTDPINIKEILNEIIDNLDLINRRYKLCNQEPISPLPECFEIENKFRNHIQNDSEIIQRFNRYSTDHIHSQIDDALNVEISQLQEEFNEKLDGIEDHFNSQTIFVNRKFTAISSTTSVAAGELSNEYTCVYHTLDHILSHLKLEDSYVLSLPSTETCDLRNSVYFFDKCGVLQANEKEMCALHIPAIRKGFEVRALFQLYVVGGKSQQLEMILVNLDKTVILSKESIYLGLRPWYERYRTKSYVQNTTNYQIALKINKVPRPLEKLPKLATGYINIIENKTLQLMPLQNTTIRTEGIMGFNEEFKQELNIIINESEELILNISGHGIMPMFIISKPLLPLLEQDPFEITEEYRLLQKIFYLEMFKSITEQDEGYPKTMDEEENSLQDIQSFEADSSETEYGSESARTSGDIKREQRFFRLIKTYILVNNNEDLPNSRILEQLLQTEKFLNHLRHNSVSCSILSRLYENYLLQRNSYDDKIAINLKHFTIQSLPFQLRTHILDMDKVYLNQYSKLMFELEFIGAPGELIAAARCALKIPGLTVDLEIVENTDNNDFIYYRSEEKLFACDKPYRNINERNMDAETNPKLKHAHSYDINRLQQHERNVTRKEPKSLRNYYNSLNKSIYMDQKYHFTHCKIFTNTECIMSKARIKVIVLFRPQKSHYKHNQNVEDYLYIDLHMGPTLPILLRAVIIDRNRT
ncbi:uncharacterized protein LOC135951140 [Calliphora vicina]|uniref:uncharacterized protein LOC135951140 n=1 Tax=Calliphora vicina TaxID=7373 RepID=UPI00325B2770